MKPNPHRNAGLKYFLPKIYVLLAIGFTVKVFRIPIALGNAAKLDPANSIARFYLQSIYARVKKVGEVVKLIAQIKRYSPDAFPILS